MLIQLKCGLSFPMHKKVKLDAVGEQAFIQLFKAYKKWHRPEGIEEIWVRWVDKSLNGTLYMNGIPYEEVVNRDPTKGNMLSIEIILVGRLSASRLLFLHHCCSSLAIGLRLNSKNWTDTTTIQTAWTVASYVATAGACELALSCEHEASLTCATSSECAPCYSHCYQREVKNWVSRYLQPFDG